MECKAGHCQLMTQAALASPKCSEERLEKIVNVTEEAGAQDNEDASKVGPDPRSLQRLHVTSTCLRVMLPCYLGASSMLTRVAGAQAVALLFEIRAAKSDARQQVNAAAAAIDKVGPVDVSLVEGINSVGRVDVALVDATLVEAIDTVSLVDACWCIWSLIAQSPPMPPLRENERATGQTCTARHDRL
eukprot:677896-Rhodomonas_salina.2